MFNRIIFNDIQRSMLGVYHSLNKHFHSQQTFDNIAFDARLLALSEQFVIGVLRGLSHLNVLNIYTTSK